MAKPPPIERGRQLVQSIDNKPARSAPETALSGVRSSAPTSSERVSARYFVP
jgi:hypothetical protein